MIFHVVVNWCVCSFGLAWASVLPLKEGSALAGNGSSPKTNNTFEKFPPSFWLGAGLNMLQVNVLDLDSVSNAVLKNFRVVKISTEVQEYTLPHSGGSWWVPKNIDVTEDVQSADSHTESFRTGEEISEGISGHAEASINYKLVQGDGSLDIGISDKFKQNLQYALFGSTADLLQSSFHAVRDDVDEAGLLEILPPRPWDPFERAVIQSYNDFFGYVGSHIITSTRYGSRFNMEAWVTNANSELNEHFKADLAVAVKGLTAGGKFDASLAGSKHYELFEENYGKGISCVGGDAIICNQIALNPTQDSVYDMYVEWTNSTASIPAITTWTTESIWSLMEFSHSAALKARKEDLSQAFTFLARHPNIHHTLFRMQIISDWGRFELLVPSAIIRKPKTGELPEDAIWTNSSVSWKSPDGKYRDILIDFIVENHGEPINVETQHGTDGTSPENGYIEVTSDNPRISLINKNWTDHELNAQRWTIGVSPDIVGKAWGLDTNATSSSSGSSNSTKWTSANDTSVGEGADAGTSFSPGFGSGLSTDPSLTVPLRATATFATS